MPLAIVETVRQSLTNGRALRRSELASLIAVVDQLWLQARSSVPQATTTPEAKRAYMRDYMRAWRARRRETASRTLPNT